MAINNEDVMAHTMIKRNLSYDVHAGIAELKRDHGDVRL